MDDLSCNEMRCCMTKKCSYFYKPQNLLGRLYTVIFPSILAAPKLNFSKYLKSDYGVATADFP